MTIPVLLAGSLLQGLALLPFVVLLGWRQASCRWSLALFALGVIVLNQLATGHTELHSFIPGTVWNWQGKLVALALALALVTILLRAGWTRQELGLTCRQQPGSTRATLTAVVLVASAQTAIAVRAGGPMPWDWETLAFQATLPTLAEELVLRGVLLALLNRAFPSRRTVLGAACGWGVPLTALSFALSHGLSVGRHAEGASSLAQGWSLAMNVAAFGRTLFTGLVYAWLRERSGSLLMPMALHSLVNTGGTMGRMLLKVRPGS